MNKRLIDSLQRGFTLTELMIAIVIIAILATFLAPNVSTYMRRNEGKSAAGKVSGALRWARNQAMSRGQVVLLDVTPGVSGSNGTIQAQRVENPACAGQKVSPRCFIQSCAQASSLSSNEVEIPSAAVNLAESSPEMMISSIDIDGSPATTAVRFCFAPDGRVLNASGQPFSSPCDGVNARIFVQAKDNNGFSNEVGSVDLDTCLTAEHSAAERQGQKDGRDLANFFVIQVPYNGAISVVQ